MFSRRDALEFGTSDEQLRAWHASGEVRRGGQGVYYIACDAPIDSMPDNETNCRRLRATLLALGAGHFASHQSALLAWELPIDSACEMKEVHVGRHGNRRWSRRPGVRLHRVPQEAAVIESRGISTICAAVAVAQVGATVGIEAAVVAADAALHRSLFSNTELASAIDLMRGAPGCTRLTTLTELVDARSESPGESRLRLIYRAAGVSVTPQAVIRDEAGHFVARVDLLVDNTDVIVEFDGLLKYRGDANREALVKEKRRELALQRLGYRVVRFIWSDLADPTRVLACTK